MRNEECEIRAARDGRRFLRGVAWHGPPRISREGFRSPRSTGFFRGMKGVRPSDGRIPGCPQKFPIANPVQAFSFFKRSNRRSSLISIDSISHSPFRHFAFPRPARASCRPWSPVVSFSGPFFCSRLSPRCSRNFPPPVAAGIDHSKRKLAIQGCHDFPDSRSVLIGMANRPQPVRREGAARCFGKCNRREFRHRRRASSEPSGLFRHR